MVLSVFSLLFSWRCGAATVKSNRGHRDYVSCVSGLKDRHSTLCGRANMWTESIPPFAIVVGAITLTGAILNGVQSLMNEGKVRCCMSVLSPPVCKASYMVTTHTVKCSQL